MANLIQQVPLIPLICMVNASSEKYKICRVLLHTGKFIELKTLCGLMVFSSSSMLY